MYKVFINNVAKGIRLLDKKTFLFKQEKFMQVWAFERYISLINTKYVWTQFLTSK